jgi:hypothetical protein
MHKADPYVRDRAFFHVPFYPHFLGMCFATLPRASRKAVTECSHMRVGEGEYEECDSKRDGVLHTCASEGRFHH